MFKRIDESPWLARRIAALSEYLAKRRGLPVVFGIVIILISFVLQIINVLAPSKALALTGIVSLYLGILVALVGFLVSEALGK
jgi:hypothetical protein